MKKYLRYFPLLVITILMINCIYVVNSTNIVFQKRHYIALIIIVLSIVLIFIDDRLSRWLTAICLLAASFNQVAFTPIIVYYTIGGSINGKGVDFEIQYLSFFLFIVFIVLNFSLIRSVFRQGTKKE